MPTIPIESSCSSTTNEDAKQEPTLTLRFIRCDEHPSTRSQFCYIQDDGSHRKRDICVCGTSPKEECPLDLHRWQAVRGPTAHGLIA